LRRGSSGGYKNQKKKYEKLREVRGCGKKHVSTRLGIGQTGSLREGNKQTQKKVGTGVKSKEPAFWGEKDDCKQKSGESRLKGYRQMIGKKKRIRNGAKGRSVRRYTKK